ncbi:bacterio-opsin activator domain-containing protein [Natrialbaceae archaeon GCM10025810]|uniref:bacterio-opsin activator domain-containing protein n=1 Tax=Halovalidus salilacus TaxID=3075124 RepID=UPI003623ECAA
MDECASGDDGTEEFDASGSDERDTSGRDDAIPAELAARVFEAAPIGTVVVDSAGEIAHANERAAEILGRSRAELIGRRYDDSGWTLYDEDGVALTGDDHPVGRVLESGDPAFGFEHWIERPDGTERWLSSNCAPLRSADGSADRVVVTFEDVTALKRRERRLTSDHLRLVEFRTDESAVPPSLRPDEIERRAEADQVRVDVDSIVSLPDGTTVQYMGTSDLTPSEFVTAVEEVPHYLDVRLLSTTDGYCRIEAHAESSTVAGVFPSLGGRARGIVVGSDEVRFLGELPGDVDPRVAAEGIREFHSGVELVSEDLVYSPHLLYDVVADALTDRQLAVLDAAYFGGYFDSPRASTGDELAARFGVTRQTFNQHLRKAQRTVFTSLFEKSGEDAR